MFSKSELDKASEILQKSGLNGITVEQVAAILRAHEVINREHVIAPFTLEDEHGKLYCGNNGYIEIDRYDHAHQSAFAPKWVTETIQSPNQVTLFDFDFENFEIGCENSEGNEADPLHVASDGVIGIGSATFEVGLPIVYNLYHRFYQEKSKE